MGKESLKNSMFHVIFTSEFSSGFRGLSLEGGVSCLCSPNASVSVNHKPSSFSVSERIGSRGIERQGICLHIGKGEQHPGQEGHLQDAEEMRTHSKHKSWPFRVTACGMNVDNGWVITAGFSEALCF